MLLRRVELLALGAWIAVSAAFLIAQQPLLDHHFVLLASTLAVPAGAGLGAAAARVPVPARYAVAGVAALAIAVGFAQEERRLWRQDDDPPGVTWAADELRARDTRRTSSSAPTSPSSRTSPTGVCRASWSTRRSSASGTGSLTDAEILEELEGVRAVVVGREFAEQAGADSRACGALPGQVSKDGVTLYLAP